MRPCNVTAEWYRDIMTKPGGVFDTIREKMPWLHGRGAVVQHDGVTPHGGRGNAVYFQLQMQHHTFPIEVVQQPAQSPDLNVLDLGIFRSLKCHVNSAKAKACSLDELIDIIETAYTTYAAHTLRNIWATLLDVYREIIQHRGDNCFKMPRKTSKLRDERGQLVLNDDMDLRRINRIVDEATI